MIRLKELKKKEYNPKFEELFYFLYSIDIDEIIDMEKTIKDDKLNVHIKINDMKEDIKLIQNDEYYVIVVDYVEKNDNAECIYQRVEYYSFKTIASLVEKLKELLSKLSNIIVIEYDKRPYKLIYNLLEYAKMEMIADDSSWFKSNGISKLWLVLADPKLNKIIFVNNVSTFHSDYYEITYHDYADNDKSLPFNKYFIKNRFDTEEELYQFLKEFLAPCLRKRRVRSIGYKYNSSRKELNF